MMAEKIMKALKFTLSGKTALFKKPDVNAFAYFTYNNIHKIALLGLLGALLGLGGYQQQARQLAEAALQRKKLKSSDEVDEFTFPEFYERLQNLKIAIVPQARAGYFVKKIQTFNNSVGYACKEPGGNLIVREQWLQNPKWKIYLLEDGSLRQELFQVLADYLINQKAVFLPYLGKNDHPAKIEKAEMVDLISAKSDHLDSLFPHRGVIWEDESYDEEALYYCLREMAPITLQPEYNFYEYQESIFTNAIITDYGSLTDIYLTKTRDSEGQYLAFF